MKNLIILDVITFALSAGIIIFYGSSMIGCLYLLLQEAGYQRTSKKKFTNKKPVSFSNNFQEVRVTIASLERDLYLEKYPNNISLQHFIVLGEIKFGYIQGDGLMNGEVHKFKNKQVFMTKVSFPKGAEKTIFYSVDDFQKIEPLEKKFLFLNKPFIEDGCKKVITIEIPIPKFQFN
jgi:hypothetical protein